MKRYDYKFTTNKGSELITVKGKGIKKAIKEFNALNRLVFILILQSLHIS